LSRVSHKPLQQNLVPGWGENDFVIDAFLYFHNKYCNELSHTLFDQKLRPTMKRMIILSCFVALANVFFTSCQNHLSREHAEKEITKELGLPKPLKAMLHIKKYEPHIKGIFVPNYPSQFEIWRQSFEKLKEMGLIDYSYTPSDNRDYLDSNNIVQNNNLYGGLTGKLTEYGKKYASSTEYYDPDYLEYRQSAMALNPDYNEPEEKDVDILLATISFGEITGIVERDAEKEARVDYTLVSGTPP
jgi:hypothetical protein